MYLSKYLRHFVFPKYTVVNQPEIFSSLNIFTMFRQTWEVARYHSEQENNIIVFLTSCLRVSPLQIATKLLSGPVLTFLTCFVIVSDVQKLESHTIAVSWSTIVEGVQILTVTNRFYPEITGTLLKMNSQTLVNTITDLL